MNKRERAAHVRRLGKHMFKSRAKIWLKRDGEFVEAVPTLAEAIEAADDMQLFIDIANGDAPEDAIRKKHARD